ncbi:hypothetical protein ASZ90_010143 [hydrocarbon metagenome]|uniref:Uncharacterized protein n=1 Tax=hydrocarbon metagenome TaxID=938273 RepID=A0A0W8FGU0_9ZZZZ
MDRTQLDEDVERVEPGVLGNCPGNDLHGFGKGLDRHLGAASDTGRIGAEAACDLHLCCAAARQERTVLYHSRDDADRVPDRAIHLRNDVLGAAAEDDGDRLRIPALRDEDHILARDLPLLDKPRFSKLPGRDGVNGPHDRAAGRTGEFLHIALLDAAGGEDPRPCKVVLGEVIDALLAEEDVCAALDDMVDDGPNHLLLFVDESLELVGAADPDLGIDPGLLELDRGVQEQDPGGLDLFGHAGVDTLLLDHHAVDDLGVLNGSPDLLLDPDVPVIDASVLARDHTDGFYGEVAEFLLRPFGSLAGHGGRCDLFEHAGVVRVHPHRVFFEDLLRPLYRLPVSLRNDGRVDVLLDEVFGLLQKLACKHDGGGGPVADLLIKAAGHLDHHLRGGVLDLHPLQDGNPVVRYHDIPDGIDEHLIHSRRPDRRLDRACDGFGRGNISPLGVAPLGALGPFPQHDYGLISLILYWLHWYPPVSCKRRFDILYKTFQPGQRK